MVTIEPLGVISLIAGSIVLVLLGQALLASMSEGRDDSGRPTRASSPLATRITTLVDEQMTVREDQYQMFAFDLTADALLTIEVDSVSGPEFEMWTLTESGFRKWEKAARSLLGGNFEYIPELSMSKTHRFSQSGRLGAGQYYIVIDNSDFGEVAPPANFANDELKVHVKITSRQ